MSDNKEPVKSFNRLDHLANERTFLAWIRTNLGIMAFGFVVGKFSFFVQKIASFFGTPSSVSTESVPQKYTTLFSTAIIGIGALLCIFVFLKFKKTEKDINEGIYQSSILLDTLLMLFVFLIGVFLILYILNS